MKSRDCLFVGLAVATVACALPQDARIVHRGIRLATSWRDGFRSTGEYVDAARRMAAQAQASGKTVAYCCSRGSELLPVDRSRVLAMSWATAPQPVKFGDVSELIDADAIVAPSDSSQAAAELPSQGYRILDSGGGLHLWAKGANGAFSSASSSSVPLRGEAVAALAVGLATAAFVAVGGFEGLVYGLLSLSALTLLCVTGLHQTGLMSSAAVLAVAFGCVIWRSSPAKREIPFHFWAGASLFAVYGALALTHTFVAPNGLGTVGGKARMLLLSAGFPAGFCTDRAFSPFQPAYPPGAAMLVLWGYSLAGATGEWLLQLVSCLWMALLFGFLYSRMHAWPERFLVSALFLTPLAIRLATQFYPESLVGLCVLVGWERIRRDSLDWIGWILVGAAGWFKNEGLVYFASLAFSVFLLIRSGSRRRLLLCLSCGAILPFAWHFGCRLAGASLDSYVPMLQARVANGVAAIVRTSQYALQAPWRYGFAFPVALAFLGWRSRREAPTLWMACLGVVFSLVCFGAIFSLSGAADIEWHLDSIERLLWVPALLIMREIVAANEVYSPSRRRSSPNVGAIPSETGGSPSGTQSREPDDQIRRCSRAWAWSIEKPFSTRQPAAAARAISGVTAGT